MAVTTRATQRSGYSGKALAAKLGLKPGMRVRLVREPPGYWQLCEFDPVTLTVLKSGLSLDFVHAFCDDRATLARALPGLAAAIAPNGMIWVSWRKKSAAPAGDLDENGVRELALPLELVDTKVCAVDATWSGLKLVWRRERRPSWNSRGERSMGKIAWIMGIIFTLAGLGMLVGGGWTMGTTLKFRRDAQVTEGKVVDFETSQSTSTSNGRRSTKTMYAPVVEYRDASGTEQRLVSSVSSSSRGYDIGEKVPVRFMPNKPGEARIDSFMENWFAPVLLSGLGLLFFGIGIGAIVAAITKARNRKWLKKNGMRVQAKYLGTIYDTSLKVNNKSPWRLTAQWQHPVTGNMHSFQSDAIWYDPSDIVKQETIDVLVNADNPKVYEVDIEFLPKSA